MKCLIQLYLKDHLFTEEKFDLPAYDHGVSAEDNFNIRKLIIDSFAKSIVVRYAKPIERCHGNYIVFAIIESKMNYLIEFEEE